jgi:hypothetical protein
MYKEFKHLKNYILCTFALTFDISTSLNWGRGWQSDREGKQNLIAKEGDLISNIGSATLHRELYSIQYICSAICIYN